MSDTGILGGSFNPPHIGHLVCARFAAEQLGLRQVLLIPLSEPSHRELDGDPGPHARLELCRLAAGGEPFLAASDIEVARGGVSYTVDTLEMLAGEGVSDPVLILGADAAGAFGDWKEPARITELARIAIAPRVPADGRSPAEAELLPGFAGARVESFAMPRIDVSSTMVRERIAAGLSIRDLVPREVEGRIFEAGWYRQDGAS